MTNAQSASDPAVVDLYGAELLRIAADSIRHGLRHGSESPVDPADHPAAIRCNGASFVTLRAGERLRGCIGSIEASRPLVADVAANAFAAAFRDSRFPEVTAEETSSLAISVSVLGTPDELDFANEADLLAQLRPGVDGIIIRCEGRRAVFLPQVWGTVPEPNEFLTRLKLKAGLDRDHWSNDFRAWRFGIDCVSSPMPSAVEPPAPIAYLPPLV